MAQQESSRARQAVSLGVAIAIPVAAGALVGLTGRETDPGWYEQIEKPRWTPPSWVFGPVWTTLYAMMGAASWLVWRRWRTATDDRTRRLASLALGLYVVQLVVNLAWTPVFFSMQRIGWALAVIAVLWTLLVATIERFTRVRAVAGVLLLPYLAWVTFASALNGAIWWMNR